MGFSIHGNDCYEFSVLFIFVPYECVVCKKSENIVCVTTDAVLVVCLAIRTSCFSLIRIFLHVKFIHIKEIRLFDILEEG